MGLGAGSAGVGCGCRNSSAIFKAPPLTGPTALEERAVVQVFQPAFPGQG